MLGQSVLASWSLGCNFMSQLSLSHILVTWWYLMKKQYTCEATMLPSIALDYGGSFYITANDELEVHPSCSVHDSVACVDLGQAFSFFYAFNPSRSPFDWESLNQQWGIVRVLSLPTIAAGRSFHTHHAVYANIIIQSIAVEWGLQWFTCMTCNRVFYFLLVSVTFRLASKINSENPWDFNEWYHAMPCDAMRYAYVSHLRGRRPSSCSLSAWKDGVMGCQFFMTSDACFAWKMKVSLGKPRWRHVSVSWNHGMISIWFPYIPMMHSKIAAVQYCYFGLKIHRNNTIWWLWLK